MSFKHHKEAKAHLKMLRGKLEPITDKLSELEAEARYFATSIERRDEIISKLESLCVRRDVLQKEIVETEEVYKKMYEEEGRQFGLVGSLSSERITERMERVGVKDGTESRQYELAWAKAILTGHQSEARSLVDTSSNQMLIPKRLYDAIEDVMKTGGKIVGLCSHVEVKGQTEWPIAKSYTDPELHDETGEQPKVEKEITLTSVNMEPQFIAEFLRTTRKFEADSIEAFWTWLVEELPDALYRVIDKKILTGGQGSKDGVHGIITNTNTDFVETLPKHALTFNTPNNAIACLDEGVDNITFAMHRRTFYDSYMSMHDTTGRPIYQTMAMNGGKVRESFGGYPVVFTSELPPYEDALSGEPYIVAGNFRAYKLNFPLGKNIKLLRDEFTEMRNNIIRYLSEIYVAGNITKLRSFVKVTRN